MKKFMSGSPVFNDYFTIEIKNNEAIFYYEPVVNRFHEKRRLISIGEMEEDDEELQPFYWIPIFNWDEQVKNHLLRKSWVTQEMIDYIETNINK